MKHKIRQTFIISDMIFSLKRMSDILESEDYSSRQELENILSTSIKISYLLMSGYSHDMFSSEEIDFISSYTKKLKKYANNQTSDFDFYG